VGSHLIRFEQVAKGKDQAKIDQLQPATVFLPWNSESNILFQSQHDT